jgi:hypothetical protein
MKARSAYRLRVGFGVNGLRQAQPERLEGGFAVVPAQAATPNPLRLSLTEPLSKAKTDKNWMPREDSNLDKRNQNPVSYH